MWVHLSNVQVKRLKKQFHDIFEQVQCRVNKWDPIGLVSGGAPDDEYDCITVQLIKLLKEDKTQEELYVFIIEELEQHFDMGINSVPVEYQEKFIKKQKDFIKSLTEWYKNYKNSDSKKE